MGGDSGSSWYPGVSSFPSPEENAARPATNDRNRSLLGAACKADIDERRSIARARIGGTRFGSKCIASLFTRARDTRSRFSSHASGSRSKRRSLRRKETTKREKRRGTRPWERTILTRRNRASRGSDRRRRENASIFSAPAGVARRRPFENRKNEEHGCSWSGSGWHSSAARIATLAGCVTVRLRFPSLRPSRSEARESALARSLERRFDAAVCGSCSFFTSKSE